MASDRLAYIADAAHPEGAKVRQLLDYLVGARNIARHLALTQTHYGTGVGSNYVELAAALGATGADAQSLLNLIGSVATELSTGTATAQLIDRAG